jgi:actin-related protein 5
MEAELREIDPEWTSAKDHHYLKETNQLFLLADLLKCHEIYFQPLLAGLNQVDLVTTIVRALSLQSPAVAQQLRSNIWVVGGGARVSGLKERLERDLKRESPTGETIRVNIGKAGAEGAFLGMQYIAKYEKELLERFSFKREEYLSRGAGYFVGNPWSNPTPHCD